MEFNQTLLFFFSALGAFNGLCLGLYFLMVARPKHISSRFLGFLLLMLSVRIGKSVVFYFNPDLAFIYLQIGLSACFFIGPFLYFYIRSMVEPRSTIHKSWKYHIIVLFPLILIVGMLYPFEDNTLLWRPYIIKGIYLQWFFYLLASAWVLRYTFKDLIDSSEKITSRKIWILSVFFGNLLIWAAYFFTNITFYLVGALTFSFLFYLLALLVFLERRNKQNLFLPEHKYRTKKIEPSEANPILEKLHALMKTEEPYTNADLKSLDLAKKINVPVHLLSQLLNENLGKSFPLFINEYRIAKACRIIKSETPLTLEAIGYECGFNSKSTFYTAFKKIKGVTPAQFKR
ncbi:MAG: helix-turn-helix domain-containing protein [Bacteroidota bacterium]